MISHSLKFFRALGILYAFMHMTILCNEIEMHFASPSHALEFAPSRAPVASCSICKTLEAMKGTLEAEESMQSEDVIAGSLYTNDALLEVVEELDACSLWRMKSMFENKIVNEKECQHFHAHFREQRGMEQHYLASMKPRSSKKMYTLVGTGIITASAIALYWWRRSKKTAH